MDKCPDGYELLSGFESHGSSGSFGMRILVGGTHIEEIDLREIASSQEVFQARELIEAAVRTALVQKDPEAMERAKQQRAGILGLFGPEKIEVEELPNGYCGRWCCKHLPWFLVTTRIGKIRIGWRKRVIHLEWIDCPGIPNAETLFPEEDVTKYENVIHCWGYDKAREYLQKLFEVATQKEGV